MSFDLPNLFLQRIRFDKNWFVLVKASYSFRAGKKIWNLELVEWPLQQLEGFIWKTNGEEKRSEKFILKNSELCKIGRTRNYLDSGTISIYEYLIDRPSSSLPIAFYKARMSEEPEGQWWFDSGEQMDFFLDLSEQWWFDVGDLTIERAGTIERAVTTKKLAIPPHVFKILVETMVARKEVCPISMEPLQLDTTVGLPCGHLFEESSLTQALQEKMTCPICRESVLEGDIQKLI
jgi:hypothetical protein